MSFIMSLPFYPSAFPIKIATNVGSAKLLPVHRSKNHQTYTPSSIVTSSTTINSSKSSSQQAKTANYVARAAAGVVAQPTETYMSEFEQMQNAEFEKMRNGGFWFRKWHMMDVTHLCLGIGKHALAVCAPFVINSGAVWVAVVLSFFTGIGVTLGYHRLLTHRSFKLPKWLEYFFTYCGCHAGQVYFSMSLD